MNSDDKLFLLDAYALIYRAYYAFIKSPRINSKGFNTSAILGFVNTLEEVLKKENPTHIGVAFDPAGPPFRHEAYEQYKAQREETPEAIRLSVPIIKDIIRAYRIPILEVAGYEADDVIGTLATEAGQQGITTYMMTPDKDYGQLVSENVFMYRPKHTGGFEVMGIEQVKAKFDIQSTQQVIDMLGLMGDASDNIPGCPGVGEKTAQKLISEFGSIENLLEHTDKLKGALKTKVENNREMIIFSKFLATIKIDVPIKLDMKALVREEPNEEELRKIFEELEFRNLTERVLGNQPTTPAPKKTVQPSLFDNVPETEQTDNSAPQSNLANIASIPHTYHLTDTPEKMWDLAALLSCASAFAFDTETTGVDPMNVELVGLSFALKEHEAYYIPIPEDQEKAREIVNIFKSALENPKSLKIGQNIKYDYIVLHNYGIHVKGDFFDTMVAHYLLQPEQYHNMDYLANVYLGYEPVSIEKLIGPKGKKQLSMRQVPVEQVCEYAAEDADVTLQLKNRLEKELKTEKMEKLFYDIEMPLTKVLADMEITGVNVDITELKSS